MNDIKDSDRTEGIVEKNEFDSVGKRIYPVYATTIEISKKIEVNLKTLEELAAIYKSPHFVISNFEKMGSDGFIQEVTNHRLHFTNIPAGLIVAYEKNREQAHE